MLCHIKYANKSYFKYSSQMHIYMLFSSLNDFQLLARREKIQRAQFSFQFHQKIFQTKLALTSANYIQK